MNKEHINIKNLGYKVIIYFFTLFLILILADIVMFSDSTTYLTKKTFLIPNSTIFIIVSLILCGLAFFTLVKKKRQIEFQVNLYLFLIIASILLFVVQLFITNFMYFYTGWDAGFIRNTIYGIISNHLVSSSVNFYFSSLPNNINLTAILLLIEKLFSHFGNNGYFGWLMVSNILVNLAGVFTFLSIYNITHKFSYAAFSWLMFALLVALSPWISIPYSDTYSILFPILAFYLYVSKKPDGNNYVRWFFISFLCFFGYTIKPTAIIVLIAIFVIECCKVIIRYDKNILLKKLVPFFLIVAAYFPVLLISLFSRNFLGFTIDKNLELTGFHSALVGLNANRDGVYSSDDATFSESFSTVKERNDADITVIKERLSDFGIIEYIKFLARKTLVNFSDGSFAWGAEGNFYSKIPENEGKIATLLRNYYYTNGKYNQNFLTGVQILWFIVLILSLGMGLFLKTPDYKVVTVMVIIIGISSFVSIFEARARYLYSFSPFFIIGAGIGAYTLRIRIEDLKQKITNRKLNR